MFASRAFLRLGKCSGFRCSGKDAIGGVRPLWEEVDDVGVLLLQGGYSDNG